MTPPSPAAEPPCPWTEPHRFTTWARSLTSAKDLHPELVEHVALAWRDHKAPLPESPRAADLTLRGAVVWSVLRLSRDPSAELLATHRSIAPHIWWQHSDSTLLLDRFAAEAPLDLPAAAASAVNASAISAEQALKRVIGVAHVALRECLDVLLMPWSRAAPFPSALYEGWLREPRTQHFALQLAHHWHRPELFALALNEHAPTQQRIWALSHCSTAHLLPAELETLLHDPRLQGAAIDALCRVAQGPQRHKPNLALIQRVLEHVGAAVSPSLPAILRHHERAWCARVEHIHPEDPSFALHLGVLGELRHPSVDALLERWFTRAPSRNLALEITRRGSLSAVDHVLASAQPLAARWLPEAAWPTVMAHFEAHGDRTVARWLAAHTDEALDPEVLAALAPEELVALHRGLPAEAEARLFKAGQDPTNPRATEHLRSLGAWGSRAWAAPLAALAIESPAEPSKAHAGSHSEGVPLGDAAFTALRALADRMMERGVQRSVAAQALLAWIEAHDLSHPALPRALELLLDLPKPICPPSIHRLLRKGSPDVCKHAIRLLKHGATGQSSQAAPFLGHPDHKLQRAAIDALADFPAFHGAIAELLTAQNMNVRRTAAKALRTSHNPAVLSALIHAITSHDNRGFQGECIRAAENIAGPAIWHCIAAHSSMQAAQAMANRPSQASATKQRRKPEGLDALHSARQLPLNSQAVERLGRVARAGHDFTRAERSLATDPRADGIWHHGLPDRLAEGEVSVTECLALLPIGHERAAIDILLRGHQEAQALDKAPIGLVKSRWRAPEGGLALLQAAGPSTLQWRWEMGQVEPQELVALLRGTPCEQDFARGALHTTPCAEGELLPLLSEAPSTARAAAILLERSGSPSVHEPLAHAFLTGTLRTAPRLPLLSDLASRAAPLERKLDLLTASTATPEQRLQTLEVLASLPHSDQHPGRFAQHYARLPVTLFVPAALQGHAIPPGVLGTGPLPEPLLDGLEQQASAECVELLLRWRTIPDPEGRVASLLEQRAAEPWAPLALQRLGLWTTHPLRAAACAVVVAAHHAPLDLGVVDQVPHAQRLAVLQALDAVVDTDAEMLDLLHLRPGQSAAVHPIDALPPEQRLRLWNRTLTDCSDPRPEIARRSLWALRNREELEEALIHAHEHPSRNVKLYANRLLRRTAPRAVWLEQCTEQLNSRDVALLRSMVRIVASQKHLPAVRSLVAMMNTSRTRDLAEDGLRLFGPAAIPELEHMLPRLRPDRRARVETLLSTL